MKNKKALLKIILSIILGITAGALTSSDAKFFEVPLVEIYGLIGTLFLNALKLVVVPLVFSSIVAGTAKMGGEKNLGNLGLKTFGAFLTIGLIATSLGAFAFSFIEGGIVSSSLEGMQEASYAKETVFSKVSTLLYQIVPSNIIQAAAEGTMLGLIPFALLFGFFASRIEKRASETLISFFQGIFEVMMKITHFIMIALPLGVFGLVAKVVATTGLQAIFSLGSFMVANILGLLFFLGVVHSAILYFFVKVSPKKHFKALLPALITGFSTSSSSATLPITFECLEEEMGVSNKITSFTLPLGTAVNMSGTAFYASLATLFIAKSFGLATGMGIKVVVILITFLTSLGIAGVPSGCLISIIMALQMLGLPGEGIALIIATDRILDMFRTVANIFGNSVAAVYLAKSEGENLKI